jgi:hypothetical protein
MNPLNLLPFFIAKKSKKVEEEPKEEVKLNTYTFIIKCIPLSDISNVTPISFELDEKARTEEEAENKVSKYLYDYCFSSPWGTTENLMPPLETHKWRVHLSLKKEKKKSSNEESKNGK